MYPQFVRQEPYFSADLIRYNTNRKAFDDPRVRLAMAWAIDRETICKKLLQGSRPAPSLTPPLGQYQPDPVIGFDKEKAQKYLADAGYPGGAGFPNYSLLAATTGTRAVIEALQAMWYENLGIKIEIRQMDFASYVTAQQNLDYDLSLGGWSGDYLDPSTFLLMWTKDNGNNNTGWSNPKFEELLSQAAAQKDPAQRLEVFRQAEHLLMEEQPCSPVDWRARNYMLRPEVKGWSPLLLDNHPWAKISLDP
jgi:oligopeptide transport system substrate-binding protein